MRVLMFGWEFPPHNSGGLGVACKGLAQALASCNIELTFVLPKRIDTGECNLNFRFADVPNMRVREADTALSPYVTSAEYEAYRRTLTSDIYGATLFAEVRRYAELATAIAQEESFDIIHAHDWLSFLAGVAAKRVSGKPLILHVHITGFEQSGGNGVDERVYEIERLGMAEADAIVTVSQVTKNKLVQYYGIDPLKVHVVHNGINAWEYPDISEEDRRRSTLPIKQPGTKMVLFLGRLTLHKGPDYFLKAAKQVLDYEPNTKFVIAGSGDMEWQLMREAAALGIANKVFFTGFARGEEWRALYRSADLYVLPSVAEPFGMTPLESILNGTPVLISKQSGVSEVLQNALRADFWDVDEMTNKIVAALRYPEMANQMRTYSRGEVLQQSWRKAADKCVAIYHSLLDNVK